LEGGMPVAVEIPLKEEKGGFTGSFKTNERTRAFFISFSKPQIPDAITDNNDDNGYYSVIYDRSGREVIGAYNALAIGFSIYNGVWKMKKNADLATAFNKKEFASEASRTNLYHDYLAHLGRTGNAADKELLKSELKTYLSKNSLTEADLAKVKDIYENILNEKENATAVFASIKQKFPNGIWKREELTAAFYEELDLAKREALFNQVLAAYPASNEENKITLYLLGQAVAYGYAEAAAYDKMESYFKFSYDRTKLAKFYMTFASKLSGETFTRKPVNVAKGMEFSDKALALLQEEMKSPVNKPAFVTTTQYLRSLNYTYHSYLRSRAILFYHGNEPDKAYTSLKQAVDVFGNNNVYLNESFAFITEKVKGPAAAQAELERFISADKANPAMKEQLKAIYMKDHSAAQFADYLQRLEQASYINIKADLAKKMISTPAPQFSLKNLSGQTVSLASLKGKVVVVDFWSTWCGPCKASFPGMQKLVDKYKNHPDVAFLFIDTWETGDERKADVTGFLSKNKYTFNVLYDEERKASRGDFVVVSDFKVIGIPTKFVIDKNGNIRFSSSGFNGSMDGLINEVTAMIELAGSAEGAGLQKKVME
jgi:thiol-disulfide isomerase/thioredoxin